jgi:hypothetical protein
VSGVRSKARSRVRTQWLALGAAFVVLAGVLVAWALSNAADRVQVVQVAQALEAGDVIAVDDLTVTGVAFDAQVQGLVPEQSLQALVGRVVAIDVQPGTLLSVGMWQDAPLVNEGEAAVGAVLAAGRSPAGLSRGELALAAPIDGTVEAATVMVRVIAAAIGPQGELQVTLAVPVDRSVAVAQLAATDQLLLVGEPAVVVP